MRNILNILIVDDHPIVRKGLKLLLEAEKGWRVAGQAADGAAAVRCAADLRPHIAIVDLNLPDSSGLDVAAEIKHLSPETRVIVLSMHMNDYYVKAAKRRGASAYVSKHVADSEIVAAVKAVASGWCYPPEFAALVADEPADWSAGSANAAVNMLTARESQVLKLLAAGSQNKDVAQRLNISVRTAEKHRAKVMRKLNLKNHAELVHFALQYDIIGLPK